MKKLLVILPILLLISCGDAERRTVNSTLHDFSDRPALMTDLELDSEVREIIVFSFPKAHEVSNFEFTKKTTYKGDIVWNQTWWDNMFNNLVGYGKFYNSEIPMDMDAELKVQDLVGKILTISNARDQAWRNKHELLVQTETIFPEIAKALNKDFPCFEVKRSGANRKNPNKGKCYLKKINKVTKSRAKKWRISSCKAATKALEKYQGLTVETNVAEEVKTEYFINEEKLKSLFDKTKVCVEIDKFVNLRADGKLLVANMIGAAGEAIGAKLLAKGASMQDVVGGGNVSEVEFDPKTMTFNKFQLAIDFNDQDTTTVYSEEAGNLTNLEVRNINNSGHWEVNFTIHTEDFRMETLGLSIALDEVFGMRMSGKTKLFYPDGTMRRGIMRIDLAIED
jgi:hypothetical protein